MKQEPMKPLAVSIEQAGNLLGGIHRATVYRLIETGKLTAIKLGGRRMVEMASIEDLVTSGRQ